jgi:hypothetical protein
MKKFVVVFFCFFASNAFASKPDSGICPWKMPFTISIKAAGMLSASDEYVPTHGPDQYNSSSNVSDTEQFSFTVDTSTSDMYFYGDSNVTLNYSLSNDTLRYGYSFYSEWVRGTETASFIMVFAHGSDSIISMLVETGEYVEGIPPDLGGGGGQEGINSSFNFQISALLFNDTSIFSYDSLSKDHKLFISQAESTAFYEEPYSTEFGAFDNQNFSAGSAELSGIFLPFNFINPAVGRMPWKLPFQINIHAVGPDTIPGILDTVWFNFTADNPSLSSNDTLVFSGSNQQSSYNEQTNTDSELFIIFVPGEDSIRTLTISMSGSTTMTFGSMQQTWQGETNFQISSLTYNDSGIFTDDSASCDHNISFTSYENTTINDPYQSKILQNFTATSTYLSGIFQPKTYMACESSNVVSTPTNNLSIYSSNSSIACSFDVSDHARDLEIFTPLGIREASYTIQAGQTKATLPHLPSGFYFVRLEGSVAKIFIGN